MNKKIKTLLLFGIFALFIGVAVFAYNMLGQKVSPQNNIDTAQSGGDVSHTNLK